MRRALGSALASAKRQENQKSEDELNASLQRKVSRKLSCCARLSLFVSLVCMVGNIASFVQVDSLEAMGFAREIAAFALRSSKFSQEHAIELLLQADPVQLQHRVASASRQTTMSKNTGEIVVTPDEFDRAAFAELDRDGDGFITGASFVACENGMPCSISCAP